MGNLKNIITYIEMPIILGTVDLEKVNKPTRPTCKSIKCCYCGIFLAESDATKEHLIPKVRGGCNSIINIKPCCKNCNAAKGSQYPEEFLLSFLRKGNATFKFRHVKNQRLMIANIKKVIYYVRTNYKKIINDEGNAWLYKEIINDLKSELIKKMV